MTITCSGTAAASTRGGPYAIDGKAPQGGREFDGAAVVDGVLTGGCGGDEDHAVDRVHVHPAAGVPAEFAQQDPFMDTARAVHPARRHQQRRRVEVAQPAKRRQHRQRDACGLVAGAEGVGDERADQPLPHVAGACRYLTGAAHPSIVARGASRATATCGR